MLALVPCYTDIDVYQWIYAPFYMFRIALDREGGDLVRMALYKD